MSKHLILTCLLLIGAAAMVVAPNFDPVEAQRGGGGGGGGKGGGGKGGGGGAGGKGGGAKGGKGMGPKGMKGGVNSQTQQADWKQPRDITWNMAKRDKRPLVLAFVPAMEIVNPAYYIGAEIARVSRGQAYFVTVAEGYRQTLPGDRGYRPPTPEEEAEAEKDGTADADAPEDEEGDEKDENRDNGFNFDAGGIMGQQAPAGAPAAPAAPAKPAISPPEEKLWRHNLWQSFGVEKGDTFILCDHLGNEFHRWTTKPPIADLVSRIERMAQNVEREEKALAKDLDDILKLKEKSDTRNMLRKFQTAFARGRYGYESTEKLVAEFDELLKGARDQMAAAKASDNTRDAIRDVEAIRRLYTGTAVETEATELVAELRAK